MTFLLVILTGQVFSQGAMVVTDVTANQTLSTQLATSAEQLSQLEKNYEILKSAEEKYEKINSIVTSVAKISDIIQFQEEAITNVKLIMDNTRRTGKSKEKLAAYLNNSLMTISRSVETITSVLQEGFFNMSDKERIDMFDKERHVIFTQVSKTRGMALPYKD